VDVIGRRALLLSGAAVLAGCTMGSRTEWLPWNPPPPLPVEVPESMPKRLAEAGALAQHLIDQARGWKLSQRRVTTLEWFVQAVDEQRRVLLSSDPARRLQATDAPPATASPDQRTAGATQAALTGQLTRLRAQQRASALPATGTAALLWSGLAAFSGTMAITLPAGLGALGDDGTELTPDLTATGPAQILQLCAQAIYGYESALAPPTLASVTRTALQSRLRSWRRLRDAVLAEVPELEPEPAPVGYDIRPATDTGGARSLAAELEAGALPILGAWLAGTTSAAQRRLGGDALGASNTAMVGFGGAALRWPGWPG